MVAFFTYLVIDAKITFAKVPSTLKEKVKAQLIALECGELAVEE